MNLNTKYFGNVTIDESELLHFKQGVPGFKQLHNFVLIPLADAPLYNVLQSAEDSTIAFIVVNPYVFFKNYEFDIDQGSKDELDLKNAEDVSLYTVMTLHDPFEKSTVNLQAPIVINQKNNKAKQLILNGTGYHTKHSVNKPLEAGDHHVNP